MKLRMAENSLFAILLRSRWWISFAIAAVLALAALAVLPSRLAPYAASVALPFLVIGTIAAYRQARQPGTAQVARTQDILRAMPWRELSDTVEQAFRLRGYEVKRYAGGSADFEVARGAQRGLVACKRWKAASHGVDALRELRAAGDAGEVQECIYIALNPLSDKASRYARENRIDLIHDVALVQLVAPVLRNKD